MERTFFALCLLGLALPAQADPRPCAAHDTIARALMDQYGESAHAMGLAEDSTVMELYAAPTTGTWTLTVTMPNGVTCLVATGKNFESIAPTQVKGDPT
ncbi:hypothetical protein [Stagnihabitans tardus]|uniref:Uncharacterized protein n=1 Tax=Stagnihabitans tardus TaxID=2699202 RepID=A0AAE5BSB9_9RHOB|nr:hypothetical protein [Stagnihabitans tardus]NBZ87650.1 hypothetical protein [Stagnihabitans tardus]